jgi:DNA (cytosine-5)-methyltransferase 1
MPRVAVHPPRRHDELHGLSLCAGVGGLDLGLHLAEPGYRAVGYVERNAFTAATLVARMADAALAPAPIWDDLRSFDGRPWRGRIHIVAAGYPCQPFSYSGQRKGADDPRHLWPSVARIVREICPEWCFFENVAGHLSLGFDHVIGELQGMGYRVAACVISAAEVGAPHARERVFILAHTNCPNVGEPRLHHSVAGGHRLQKRSQSNGESDRFGERIDGMDVALGYAHCDELDTRHPGLFPPEPGDFAQWGEVLSHRLDLKPCLHRLDDGLASWMERSMAAGNGVVPMAAARAWRLLKAELLNFGGEAIDVLHAFNPPLNTP